MLGGMDLNSKSYEQFRKEAIERIPIYSSEWTNYNVSDPGITILENFAAFMALQQSEIDEVPEAVKWKLLKLVGFSAHGGNPAKAYILFKSMENKSLENRQETVRSSFLAKCRKFYAQDICFEPRQSGGCGINIKDMRIETIRSDSIGADKSELVSALLFDAQGVRGGLALIGTEPSGGEKVWFYLKNIPDSGQTAAIRFELAQRHRRSQINGKYRNPFAEFLWEIKTREGYAPIAVEDGTYCFLQSGYVVFSLGEELCNSAIKSEADNAYVIRLTVRRAEYDLVPYVGRVVGLLTEVVQKDTQSEVMLLSTKADYDINIKDDIDVTNDNNVTKESRIKNDIYVTNEILKNGYLEVYGKEPDGQFHRYYDADRLRTGHGREKESRRCFHTEYISAFIRKLIFDVRAPEEILAVCRDEALTAYRKLGVLQGYDRQIIPLPNDMRVYQQDFSVLVVEETGAGDRICHVVGPESGITGEVRYGIEELENVLIIYDCGRYEGAELRLGNFARYMGEHGNIRAGSELVSEQEDLRICFENCTDTSDGKYEDTLEKVRAAFAADIACAAAMVTKKDCEQIVSGIEGLALRKIGVCPAPEKNEIHVTALPDSGAQFPVLSEVYRRELARYLERYRMLTTKIVIEQPVYVSVNVTAAVCFKKQFGSCKEQVEQTLREQLDGIHSDVPFGHRIAFHALYRSVESLDCVEEIREFKIYPGSHRCAETIGLDIQLKPNALHYCGNVRIENVEVH